MHTRSLSRLLPLCLPLFFAIPLWIYVIRPYIDFLGRDDWVQTRCTILASRVSPASSGYHYELEYAYEFAGTRHTSTAYYLDGQSNANDASALPPELPIGAGTCFVNRRDPSRSAIQPALSPQYRESAIVASALFAASLLFALMFLVKPGRSGQHDA